MDDKLLLAQKKRGFGVGKINGIGGKQNPDEAITQTMLRETMEEIGVVPTGYRRVAILDFDEYDGDTREFIEVHVYMADGYEGEIIESEEMKPQWFGLNELPYDRMFPDDIYFLPLLLEGKLIKGFFKYDKQFNMLEKQIDEVNEI